jgi:hypothetical protein
VQNGNGRGEHGFVESTRAHHNCQSAFLAIPVAVVLFDAPPTIGHNLPRAVDEVAAAEGVGNTVTHVACTHNYGRWHHRLTRQ